MPRVRVLFVVEAVTLAQIVRARALAGSLDPDRYEVHFASASFPSYVFDDLVGVRRWPITSLDAHDVEEAVARGTRIYEESTLARYVAEERAILRAARPHVVVGDLRWSLSISAALEGVPFANLINAYWSPFAVREKFPVPDHPIVERVGLEMAEAFFPIALPGVFAHFVAPLDALRRRHGLAPFGDLRAAMTAGDAVLFPDEPTLVPTNLPAHEASRHHYLGHVGWSPRLALDPRVASLGERRPFVYATLGSSGATRLAPILLEALAALDVDAVVATAGRFAIEHPPANVRVVDLAPGDLLAAKARVVVCNGGASTAYQAIERGTPVVGIPTHLDAYLAMQAMHDAGVGLLVRGGTCTAPRLREAIGKVLETPSFAEKARAAADRFRAFDPASRFNAVLDRLARARGG